LNNEDYRKQFSDGIYRPPKMAAVFNDIDETPEEKAKKQFEKAKIRMMNMSIMKEIENEYSGAPEEIRVKIFRFFFFLLTDNN
jgi:hypothetical protein